MRSVSAVEPRQVVDHRDDDDRQVLACEAGPVGGAEHEVVLVRHGLDVVVVELVGLPSRPWPYSAGRALGGAAGSSADRGMWQVNHRGGCALLLGLPESVESMNCPPGSQPLVR